MNISVIKREKHKIQNKTTLVKINLCSFVCISSSAWQLAIDGDTYLTSWGGKDWWHTGPPPPSQVLPDGLRKFPFIFYFLSYTNKSVQRCLHPSLVADSGAGTIGDTSLYLPESLSIFIWKKQPASYLEQVLPESTEFRWGCSSQLTPPSWLVVHSQAVATHTHSACCWSY